MTWYWFPDTTVLRAFASVSRLPLLKDTLRGRGRWPDAVAHETARAARVHPCLAAVARDGWLGDPIEIDDAEDIAQVERLRRAVFGGSSREPLRRLGEAQTCHLILRRYAGSSWITDDRDARQYARAQGITTRDTLDLIAEAVAEGHCSRDEGSRLPHLMRRSGNHLRVSPHLSHL